MTDATDRADAVDAILGQWQRQRPDVDASPMAVIGRVARLARHFDRRIRANLARFDLEPASFDVLATLRRAGAPYALSPGGLMRTAMVTSGAITQRLDRLEERGLVSRAPNPDDVRGVVVTLTPAGRELVDEVLPSHAATEAALLAGLDAAERAEVAGLLRKLVLALEHEPAR